MTIYGFIAVLFSFETETGICIVTHLYCSEFSGNILLRYVSQYYS